MIARWLVALAPLLTAMGGIAHAQPVKHAVLIAVSKYEGTGLASLSGPPNDIAAVAGVLKNRFGFASERIAVLEEERATHTLILNELRKLDVSTRAGDFVYLHYSGHGSFVPGTPSGTLQTWVSYGARRAASAGLDRFDVLDKEIHEALRPLYRKGVQVILVSDSCHSATVARARLGLRAAPPAREAHPLALKQWELAAADSPGIRVGAALDQQLAVEADPATQRPCESVRNCYGLFTWHWVRSLDRARHGESWQDVFRRAEVFVLQAPISVQQPQIEGKSALVFENAYPVRAPSVPVTAVDSLKGTVTLSVGAIAGATTQSRYRLANPPEGSAAGSVRITDVQPFSSSAVVESGTFRVADLLIESEHAYTFNPISYFVTDASSDGRYAAGVAAARKTLRGINGFSEAAAPLDATWVVNLGISGYTSLGPPGSPAPAEIWATNSHDILLDVGLRSALDRNGSPPATFFQNLQRYARTAEIKALQSDDPPPVQVTILALRRASECAVGQQCRYLPPDREREQPYIVLGEGPIGGKLPSLRRGDVLSFSITNRDPARSWHAYLLDIDPRGRRQVIFPSRYEGSAVAKLERSESRPLQRMFLSLSVPGVETIKLLVSDRSIQEIELLESDGYVPRADRNPFERLLQETGTRNGSVHVPVRAWSTAQIDIAVLQ